MNTAASRPAPRAAIKVFLVAALCLGVAAILAFLALNIWFNAFLKSDKFRLIISHAALGAVQADGEFLPFHYAGTTIYTDGFQAGGVGTAFFDRLQGDQMRAAFNLHGMLKHTWQIDELDLQRLQISVASSEEREGRAPVEPARTTPGGWGILPNKVDLRQAVVEDANIEWKGRADRPGGVTATRLTVTPDDSNNSADATHPGAWNILAEGGHLAEIGLPELGIGSARLKYRRPSLFVLDSELKCKDSGTLAVSGEINFTQALDLDIKLNGVPAAPLLPMDWRKRLEGNLNGDVHVRSAMPMTGAPDMEGSLSLSQGRLEALPVLDQIATFTRSQQFRTLDLSIASGDFKRTATRLEVKNFILESKGLIRMEGAFNVVDSTLDGTFQVGVTPGSLQWLPGSQGKVFTASREGYLWTSVRLSGPVGSPTEDLTPRLVAAAQGAIIEGVEKTVKDPVGTVLEGVKSFLPQ